MILSGTVAPHQAGLVILSDDRVVLTPTSQDSDEDISVELTPGPTMHDAVVFSRHCWLTTTRTIVLLRPD